ncbi:2-aminoadipate transaminase [Propionispora sp. 2/2-37]|uniref:aminotransferase-like domain-containing protein n=1 Tax=Propionispora sp. 2/2-37 TaxID=1677858 RepID=UPI0006BB6D7B|nr:PLP-dependent aminotransferase family protein [Propionispora sp. 2/2-37]CUH96731.1 2-aminoadipate transaminase [Propionispora sp. 2/2-37]
MTVAFARRMEKIRASEIREILKITQQCEMISFAGGLPAPELFPVEELKQVAVRVLQEAGSKALQYSTTEGYPPLRRQIAARINRKFGTGVESDNILITSGSQQALDFSGKLFLDEGDVVLCESPTYLAALSAFKAYLPRFIAVPTDEDGMIPGALAEILRTTPRVKLLYVIPDFQNPTGRTWSLERRKALIELVNQYEIPVIEDNPYGELRFENEILPSLKSLDSKGLVIFTSTFSKTFCPGMRIGWIAADRRYIEKYVLIKQGADLHTSSISQMELSRYLDLYDFEANIQNIITVYRQRRNAMLAALDENLAGIINYTRPQGGLFLWVELPKHITAVKLLTECLKRQVAFVPGDSFFPNGGVEHTLRLNYSNMPEEKIRTGIIRLADAVKEYM